MKVDYPFFNLFKVLIITIVFIMLGVWANAFDTLTAMAVKTILFFILITTLYNIGILSNDDKNKAIIFLNKKFGRHNA